MPNVSQLEGGAIQLTPFEVVSSTRRADVVAAPWRYVQFEYGVRLLADGFFGQDVNIPALTVTYNFRTADGANTGRDQSYVLPALPMRVLSLVPRGATDIRDTSAMTFGDIESARFRAHGGARDLVDRHGLRRRAGARWRCCARRSGSASACRKPSGR